MNDNPYLNQGDWGRDLLFRLGQLTTGRGAINSWSELPTTGKNGELLNESHEGYSGMLIKESETSLHVWDGYRWDKIMSVPMRISGEQDETLMLEFYSQSLYVLNPSFGLEFFFVVSSGSTADILQVSQFNKNSGVLNWSTSISLGSGLNYFSLKADDFNISYATDESYFYVGITGFASQTSLTGKTLKVFAFNLNGSFAWERTLYTTSGSTETPWISGMISADGSLFAYSSEKRFFKINRLSGVILIDTVLNALPTNPIYSQISFDYNSSKLVVQGSAFISIPHWIALVDTDLSSVTNVNVFDGNPNGIVLNNLGIQDPLLPSIFYVQVTAALSYQIWSYNSATLGMALVYDFPSEKTYGNLVDCFVDEENSFWFVFTKGEALYFVNSLQGVQVKIPGGSGGVVRPGRVGEYNDSFRLLKVSQSALGYGSVKKVSGRVYLSSTNKQYIYFGDVALSVTDDLSNISKQANFLSVDTFSFSSASSSINRLKLGGSTPSNTGSVVDPSEVPSDDMGLKIGAWGGAFSLNSPANGVGLSSHGYTGTDAGKSVAGLAFGCDLIAGRFVSNSLGYASCVELFDPRVEKLFIGLSRLNSPNDIISNFPNSSGVTITAANGNYVGIGTESPGYKLDVLGTIRGTEVRNSGGVITSDPKMKLNMKSLDGADSWQIVNLLTPISFLYKPDFAATITETSQDEEGNEIIDTYVQRWPLPQGIQIGYNADEVSGILPELIDVESRSGVKYLNIGAIAPIVHQGTAWKINQLQQIIEQQQTLIESLTARVEALENAA